MQLDIGAYELALLQERMERKLDLAGPIRFDPKKHPRDWKGQFRKVLVSMKVNDTMRVGNKSIRRQEDGWRIGEAAGPGNLVKPGFDPFANELVSSVDALVDKVEADPSIPTPEAQDWAGTATEKLAPYADEVKRTGAHDLRIFPKRGVVEALAKRGDPDWPFNYEHEKWERSYEISGGWEHGKYFAGGPHIPMPSDIDSIRFDTLDEAIEAVKAGLIDQELAANPGPSTKWIHERGRAAKAHNERLHRGGF